VFCSFHLKLTETTKKVGLVGGGAEAIAEAAAEPKASS